MLILRSLRESKGKTQMEMAKFLEVDRTTYVKYERGQSEPNLDTVSKLADYFGVTTDYLLGRTDIPNVYAHDITLPDGRKGSVYTTQKDLSPEVREQVGQETQRATSGAGQDVVTVHAPSLSREEVERIVTEKIRQLLQEQGERGDDGQ